MAQRRHDRHAGDRFAAHRHRRSTSAVLDQRALDAVVERLAPQLVTHLERAAVSERRAGSCSARCSPPGASAPAPVCVCQFGQGFGDQREERASCRCPGALHGECGGPFEATPKHGLLRRVDRPAPRARHPSRTIWMRRGRPRAGRVPRTTRPCTCGRTPSPPRRAAAASSTRSRARTRRTAARGRSRDRAHAARVPARHVDAPRGRRPADRRSFR